MRLAKNMDRDQAAYRLTQDLARLQSLSRELKALKKEMHVYRNTFKVYEKDYFTADEHEKIAGLMFRYLACRKSLWDMVYFYLNYKDLFKDKNAQIRGFVIGFNAALHLTCYTSLMVATFHNEAAGKAKLNEAYFQYDIPEGTFDRLHDQITNVDHLRALKAAWMLYTEAAADTASPLNRIVAREAQYRDLKAQIDRYYADSWERINYLLKQQSEWMPKTANALRHSAIAKYVKEAAQQFKDDLYAARALIFESIGNLKTPVQKLLKFSGRQKKQIKQAMRAGDIVLTFTSGYMSNVFLPGKFKHGIVYVGLKPQRQSAGLTPGDLPETTDEKQLGLKKALSTIALPTGHQADVIEAVAEGVIFNSMDPIMEAHVSRMVVLRPKISEKERQEGLLSVFQLVGNGYDFHFDFASATYHCCTEVIYRALHARGSIDFNLTKRMGSLTLSADDIINYYLDAGAKTFDFVLYVDGYGRPDDFRARIHTGQDGQQRLLSLMKQN